MCTNFIQREQWHEKYLVPKYDCRPHTSQCMLALAAHINWLIVTKIDEKNLTIWNIFM